jgi:HEPN domain-containing protein
LSAGEHLAEAHRWLRFAQEDLAAAAAISEGEFGSPRQACSLAQQAAEKALKSVLVARQVDFPRTHDLDLLRGILESARWPGAAELPDLAELTEWAVESRYPGDWPEPTLEEAARALTAAQTVVDIVTRHFPTNAAVDIDL